MKGKLILQNVIQICCRNTLNELKKQWPIQIKSDEANALAMRAYLRGGSKICARANMSLWS
jgi:hypothetical protein